MKKATFLLLILAALFTANACGDKNECDTAGVTYNNDIKAIFDKSCALVGCHKGGSVDGDLDTYENAKNFAYNDKMLGAIKQQAGFSAMPKTGSKLDDCSISKIEAWINAGRPE